MDVLTYIRAQWDRAAAVAAVLAGAIALVLGWIGVSGAVYPAEQLPYIISGGLGGFFLLGLGGLLWLSADLRDEWRKLDQICNTKEIDLAGTDDAGSSSQSGGSAEIETGDPGLARNRGSSMRDATAMTERSRPMATSSSVHSDAIF